MTRELQEMRDKLVEISEDEATKLYRMAWRLKAHGGSTETIEKIRSEARELHMNAYPERLLDPFKRWEFAFKC